MFEVRNDSIRESDVQHVFDSSVHHQGNHDVFKSNAIQMSVLLKVMEINPGTHHNVIMDPHALEEIKSALPERQKRLKLDNDNWKSEHLELFEFAHIQWPPCQEKFKGVIDFQDLSEREFEVVVFCHVHFLPQPQEIGQVFSFDCNDSLKRTVGWPLMGNRTALRNPWKGPSMGTLVGSSHNIIRITDPSLYIRPLSGVESMVAIGWDMSLFVRGNPYKDDFSDKQLRSLAGNAFSGFAIAPLLASLTAVLGMFKNPPPVCDTPNDSASADEDSSGSD